MKILHTSDWHLGQNFYGYDRSEEHRDFLRHLSLCVEREQPDALLVCGDIFDTMQPSAASSQLYYDHLLALHDACPAMTIVVIAGNHDSPSRLEVGARLWQRLNVRVVANVSRTDEGFVDLSHHLIPIHSATGDGSVVGYVAAVPYLRGSDYRMTDEEQPNEQQAQQRFVARLLELGAERAGDLPLVLMMHAAVRELHTEHGEERIGNVDYQTLDEVTGPRDYLALGHIHRPHTITRSNCRARYCGSPFAMSFDEDYDHSVTLAELNGHAEPVLTQLTIPRYIPLLTIPNPSQPYEQALEALDKYDDNERAYVRVNIATDGYLPGSVREQIVERLKDKQLMFCDILKTSTQSVVGSDRRGFSLEEFRQLKPMEVAEQYFQNKKITLDGTFRLMLEQVMNEQPQNQ